MTTILTKQMLIDAEACEDQVAAFERLFGDSVNVTVAKARKVAKVFEWDFARRFLDAEGLAEYDRAMDAAWAEYERVTALDRAEYERVTALDRAEYNRVRDAAWAEYERVTALDRAEYERVTAPAWAEYKRVTAPAWAKAYIATCKRRAALKGDE